MGSNNEFLLLVCVPIMTNKSTVVVELSSSRRGILKILTWPKKAGHSWHIYGISFASVYCPLQLNTFKKGEGKHLCEVVYVLIVVASWKKPKTCQSLDLIALCHVAEAIDTWKVWDKCGLITKSHFLHHPFKMIFLNYIPTKEVICPNQNVT